MSDGSTTFTSLLYAGKACLLLMKMVAVGTLVGLTLVRERTTTSLQRTARRFRLTTDP